MCCLKQNKVCADLVKQLAKKTTCWRGVHPQKFFCGKVSLIIIAFYNKSCPLHLNVVSNNV